MAEMKKLVLPALRGRIGDWFYYVSLLPFKEVAQRISMADEIHKSKDLRDWIQTEVSQRIEGIVTYLETQEQRFFNSLILGIYGGSPSWQELDIKTRYADLEEEDLDYLNRTFGILTLKGDEKIFPIDGQHRTQAIKDALKNKEELQEEEISVIATGWTTRS